MKKRLALLTLSVFVFVSMIGVAPAMAVDAVWQVEAPMSVTRYFPATCIVGDKLYVIGGITSGGPNVEIFDSTNKTWSAGTPMPVSKERISAVAYDQKIYVIGGASTDIYDINSNTWSTGTPIPKNIYWLNIALVGDKIYVIGGNNTDATVAENTVYIYDIPTNSWSMGSPMPTPRVPSLLAVGTKIYAFGGLTTPNRVGMTDVEVYDTVTDTWSKVSSMSIGRNGGSANVLVGNKIYVIGGGSAWSVINDNSVEIYDFINDTWEMGPSTNRASAWFGGGIIGNNIYIVGGEQPAGTRLRTLESLQVDIPTPTDPDPESRLQILLVKGEQINLTALVKLISNMPTVDWTSADDDIAAVDTNGTVTANDIGTTTITVRNEDGTFVASVKVKVVEGEAEGEAEFRLSILLRPGEICRLELEGDEDIMATWTSSDTGIATAETWRGENRIGQITAIAEGSALITASDGEQVDQIYVVVRL